MQKQLTGSPGKIRFYGIKAPGSQKPTKMKTKMTKSQPIDKKLEHNLKYKEIVNCSSKEKRGRKPRELDK